MPFWLPARAHDDQVPRHRRAVRRDAATHDLAKADTSADGRRAAADGAARRRHVLLRFPNRRSLRVQLDRAARQLVRAVRGAVHVLPGRGKLVPGRIIMSKYKSILGVVIMPHRIVQKHVDEIGRHRTDIRVVERRKDITQVPRVLAENENNRLCDLFEMLGDIVR